MESLKDIFNLASKNVVITGGYGHLGSTMCNVAADFGANVYLLGRSLESFKKADLRPSIKFIECDVSNTDSILNAFSQIDGKIDCLVNNAFYCKDNDPLSVSDESWEYSIDGTLNSVYRCIREAVKHLNNGASIINVASMYGMISPDFDIYSDHPKFLNSPQYGAAKAGVIQMTKYFATYLGKKQIRVNALVPGAFPSEAVQSEESFIDKLKDKSVLNRIGNPKDLAGATVLLMSNASSFITGQSIVVDGGWTIK